MFKKRANLVALSFWFSVVPVQKSIQVNEQSDCGFFKLPIALLPKAFYKDPEKPTRKEWQAVFTVGLTCKKMGAFLKSNNWLIPVDTAINQQVLGEKLSDDYISGQEKFIVLARSSLDLDFNKFYQKKIGLYTDPHCFYSLDNHAVDQCDFYLLRLLHSKGFAIAKTSFPEYRKDENDPGKYQRFVAIVTYYLRHGFDIASYVKHSKQTTFPITDACKMGHKEVVQLLLDHGCPVDLGDDFGTPLSYACKSGFIDIVKLLTQKGANLDLSSKENYCPFITACSMGYLEIAEFLAASGANVNIVNYQETALSSTLSNYKVSLTPMLMWLLQLDAFKLVREEYERAKKNFKKVKLNGLLKLLNKKWKSQKS